jgi:osmoprotectant transport system permease protein
MSPGEFLRRNGSQMLSLTIEHLGLVGLAMVLAVGIGVPLGVLLVHRPGPRGIWQKLVLGGTSIMQTVPSLALFGFLLPLPWLGARGERSAVTALTLYALLPVVRNTFIGVRDVDPAVREAGIGMGMTSGQLLRQVELPLAMGVILAGIRVAAVTSIGVATIAAAIGAGGLGEFIFRGVASVSNELILAGAIPAALLAIGADYLLGRAERRLRAVR